MITAGSLDRTPYPRTISSVLLSQLFKFIFVLNMPRVKYLILNDGTNENKLINDQTKLYELTFIQSVNESLKYSIKDDLYNKSSH